MEIIALDIAGKTGYCLEKDSGTWDFSRKGKVTKAFQMQDFYTVVKEKLRTIDFVAYEKPGGRFFSGVRSHANFEGVLLLCCQELGAIPYKGYSATQIKKFITGKGNASKQDVITAVKELGFNPTDDNEADAIALYLLAQKEQEDEASNG